MKRVSLLALAALLLFIPSFAQNAAAQIQMRSSVTVQRTCSNELVIQWIAYDPVKIEYSVTDTSLDWTGGMKEVADVDSQIHSEPIGRAFDKVIVNFTFADGEVERWDANVGQCSDIPVPPEPPTDLADALIIICVFVGDQEVEKHLTVGELLLDNIATSDRSGNLTLTERGSSFVYLEPCSGMNIESSTLLALDSPGDIVTYCENGETKRSAASTPKLESGIQNLLFKDPYLIPFSGYYLDWNLVADVITQGECGADIIPTPTEILTPMPTETVTPTPTETVTPFPTEETNSLIVHIELAGDVNIEGAPYGVFAPQATAQFMAEPYLTGVVGPNNTISIDGLMQGQYRLVVSPEGMDPIDAILTVGDTPVTELLVAVDANGNVTVSQFAPGTAVPAPTAALTETAAPGNASSPDSQAKTSTGSVSGLPSTGTGAQVGNGYLLPLLMAAALIAFASMATVAVSNRRKH